MRGKRPRRAVGSRHFVVQKACPACYSTREGRARASGIMYFNDYNVMRMSGTPEELNISCLRQRCAADRPGRGRHAVRDAGANFSLG
jgi:hypothetical protein